MTKKLIPIGILSMTVAFPAPGTAAQTPKTPAGQEDPRKDRAEESQENMNIQNLFDRLPARSDKEVFETLLQNKDVKLERIISTGQASPPGQWYDEELNEWVLLLAGSAGLRFEDEPGARTLNPGDYLLIPAHRRHRVEWTSSDRPAVWLALHFS